MSDFIIKKNVPILDEHTLKDDDGNVIVEINEDKLRKIAQRNNARVRQTGDMTPLVIGHTEDGESEEEQPEIVGYACDFKVVPFFKTGRKCVAATFKFFKDKIDKVKQYPRRSVELWLSDWKIDPIALLGATTPERDLGLLQLASGGKKKLRRIMFNANPGKPKVTNSVPQGQNPEAAAIANAVVEMLKQTDVWQFMEQQMAEAQAPDPMSMPNPGLDPLAGAPPMPPMPPEDDEDVHIDIDSHDDEESDEDADEEPARYSAVSTPSGTNTFTPSYVGSPRKMSRPSLSPELISRIKMAADQRRAEVVRYQRALHQLAAEHEDLRLKFARAEREKDLIQLESEGYTFDRAEELDFVMSMDDEQYQAYLGKIRKRYQRAPVGPLQFSAHSLRSAGPSAGRDRESAVKIAEYAAEKGITYAQALAELEGK